MDGDILRVGDTGGRCGLIGAGRIMRKVGEGVGEVIWGCVCVAKLE